MCFTCFVFVCVSLLFIPLLVESSGTVSDENEQEHEANFEIPRDQDPDYDDAVIYEVPRVQVEDHPSEEYDGNGDESSEIDHYTFVALIDIMFTDGCKRTCTGAIIHDNVVITAAHCFTMVQRKFLQPELSLSFVVIGTRRMFETGYEQYLPIEKVITHPRFRDWTADLALVYTFANMYSDKPAEILPLAVKQSSVPVDTNVTVLSWGKCTSDVQSDAERSSLRQKKLESDKENQPALTETPDDNTDDMHADTKDTEVNDNNNNNNNYNRNKKRERQRIYHRDGKKQVISKDINKDKELSLSMKTIEKSIKEALTSNIQEEHIEDSFETPDSRKLSGKNKIEPKPRFKLHDGNDEVSKRTILKQTKVNKNENKTTQHKHRSQISTLESLQSPNDNQQEYYIQQQETMDQTTTDVIMVNASSWSEETTQPSTAIIGEYNYEEPETTKWINTTSYPSMRVKKVLRKPVAKVKIKLPNIYSSGSRRGNSKQPSIQPFFDLQDYDGVSFVKPFVKTKRNETNEAEYIFEKIKKPVETRRKLANGKFKDVQQRKRVSAVHKNRRNGESREYNMKSGHGNNITVNKKKVRRYNSNTNLADLKKYKNWRRDIGEQHNNLTLGKFSYINLATCKKMVERTLPRGYGLKNKHEYLCYSSEELYITNEDSGAPVVQNGELAAVTIGGVDSEGDHIAIGIKVACFCEWIASNLPDNDGLKLKCCTNCCHNKSHDDSNKKEEPGPELRASQKKKTRQSNTGENEYFPKYYKKRFEKRGNY